jgi:hypothetical protein
MFPVEPTVKKERPPASCYSAWACPRLNPPKLLGVFSDEAEARKAVAAASDKGMLLVVRGSQFSDDAERVVFTRQC